jgi:serine/threonine protein kinase
LLDADGNGLLTDFGIARRVAAQHGGDGPTLAGTGLPVGTPQYMSPEQLRGEDLDQRTDVYALGAVLYESLTGIAPHVANSPFEVAALALSASIVPPSQRNPQVWPELEQVVLKALARQATNRYPDMYGFSAALELALRRHVTHSTVATLTALQKRETGTRVLASLRELRWTRRTVALALAVVLLIATAGGTALVMTRDGTTSRGPLSAATSSATASETQASETVVALIPAATMSAQPSVSPAPRASPTPSPTLIVNPTPWVLQPTQPGILTGNCIGTQTIRNTTSQTVGWQWLQPQGGFHFQVNGGPDMGWPKNLQPGIPPHGTDTVTATGKCQPQPKPYGILLTDSLGDQYTFVLQLQ